MLWVEPFPSTHSTCHHSSTAKALSSPKVTIATMLLFSNLTSQLILSTIPDQDLPSVCKTSIQSRPVQLERCPLHRRPRLALGCQPNPCGIAVAHKVPGPGPAGLPPGVARQAGMSLPLHLSLQPSLSPYLAWPNQISQIKNPYTPLHIHRIPHIKRRKNLLMHS